MTEGRQLDRKMGGGGSAGGENPRGRDGKAEQLAAPADHFAFHMHRAVFATAHIGVEQADRQVGEH